MNTIYIGITENKEELQGNTLKNFGQKRTLAIPILEDFDIEAQTEFASFGDMLPAIQELTNILSVVDTIDGTMGRGTTTVQNMLSAQRYVKTNPIKIALTMHFYTKTDALTDVILPLNLLLSLHLPWKTTKGIALPGINAKNMGSVISNSSNGEATSSTGKTLTGHAEFISLLIPGVVYVDSAMLYDIKPTYSRQVTKNGYPLWATAAVQFWGIRFALANDFTNALNFKKDKWDSDTYKWGEDKEFSPTPSKKG